VVRWRGEGNQSGKAEQAWCIHDLREQPVQARVYLNGFGRLHALH
jgi:hypothetical protein